SVQQIVADKGTLPVATTVRVKLPPFTKLFSNNKSELVFALLLATALVRTEAALCTFNKPQPN
ncbi:hypothetical protein ACPXBS_26060, partial [Escherichia coli]|uniref:hypothetical protein n=1 Tax=Escherichia coli TaxID=562 RepID=UPI003CE596E2